MDDTFFKMGGKLSVQNIRYMFVYVVYTCLFMWCTPGCSFGVYLVVYVVYTCLFMWCIPACLCGVHLVVYVVYTWLFMWCIPACLFGVYLVVYVVYTCLFIWCIPGCLCGVYLLVHVVSKCGAIAHFLLTRSIFWIACSDVFLRYYSNSVEHFSVVGFGAYRGMCGSHVVEVRISHVDQVGMK